MSKLAANPYSFNKSKFFDREEFINKDVLFLTKFFNKLESEIYEASKSYIGREKQLFYFNNAIKFWHNALEVQLTDDSTTLSSLVAIFSIEALVGNQIKDNGDRFRSFLLHYLTREQKIEFLSSYTFGVPYELGQGRARKKHLCHRAVILSQNGRHYNRSFCSSGTHPICACREWLEAADTSKINKYLNMFGVYFYRMRSSVVHDASFVRFTSMPFFDKDLGNVVPTAADAFSNNSFGVFTSYDTDLTVQRFHQILKDAAWQCFNNGSKIKLYAKAKLLTRL